MASQQHPYDDAMSPESRPAHQEYTYTPLPSNKGSSITDRFHIPRPLWTRLLTIHPAKSYANDIVVDLTITGLVRKCGRQQTGTVSHPKFKMLPLPLSPRRSYEALSYVWGPSDEKPGIVFVGRQRRMIRTTENLDTAIRHLRKPDRSRIIWIDALCIDQSNTEECSRQVRYMCYIFWSTPRVVVWLGPQEDDSDYAIRRLHDIGTRIRIPPGMVFATGITEEDDEVWGWRRALDKLPLSARDTMGIRAIMQRKWFERVWVRQEVFQAHDGATLCCGTASVPWEPFRRGLLRTQSIAGLRAPLVSYIAAQQTCHFMYLRSFLAGASCSNPRDYIYGMLGMMDGQRFLQIVPDYSISVKEVYCDVARRFVEHYESLQLLMECGTDGNSAPPIPTWVPNWSAALTSPLFLQALGDWFSAFRACASFLENDVLRVAGSGICVVKEIVHLDVATQEAFRASVRALVPADALSIPYPGGGNLWDALSIGLCGECFSDRTNPPDDAFLMTYEDSATALENIMSGEALGSAQEALEAKLRHMVGSLQKDCQLFLSYEGHVGWAPKKAGPGDQLTALLGCTQPLVLREASQTDHTCMVRKVVGSCYLQGFMYDEAWIGPLPDGIRRIWNTVENYAIAGEFLNLSTGESVSRDPRLASLPIDALILEERGKGLMGREIKIEPEVWQSLGVQIEYFNLV